MKSTTGWILLSWFLVVCFAHGSYRCEHIAPKTDEVVRTVRPQPIFAFRDIRDPHVPTGLSFKVHMDESFKRLPTHQMLKTNLVDPALRFWERALMLRSHIYFGTKFNRSCKNNSMAFLKHSMQYVCRHGCNPHTYCGPAEIPDAFLNCQAHRELQKGRCPRLRCSLSTRGSHRQWDQSQADYFVKHELLHVLGFSTSLFAFFRDAKGTPFTARQERSGLPSLGWHPSLRGIYQWSDEVARTETRKWESALGTFDKQTLVLRTPAVLRVSREYFGCPELNGVELEDQGNEGVSLSHWEMRILGNELMTASFINTFRLSALTLALLEDTGWYLPNYAVADSLGWGANRGCVFATQSCYSFMRHQIEKNLDIAPFCLMPKDDTHFSCTPDQRSFGSCNLLARRVDSNQRHVHQMFELFSEVPSALVSHVAPSNLSGFLGGTDLTDFCPFLQEVTWTSSDGVFQRSSQCNNPLNSKALLPNENYNLEIYGPESVCVELSNNWSIFRHGTHYDSPIQGAGCYKCNCKTTSLDEDEDESVGGRSILELAGGLLVTCPSSIAPGHSPPFSACLLGAQISVAAGSGAIQRCADCQRLCASIRAASRRLPPNRAFRLSNANNGTSMTISMGLCSENRLTYSNIFLIFYLGYMVFNYIFSSL